MTTVTSGATKLRQMLNAGETIIAPSAITPLTARLVEHLGFKAVYVGGWMTGATLTTSEPLVTMREQVDFAAAIAKVVDIPVMVDGGAGFGDAVHTMRAVREFEMAGIAGIHIEDQVYPKRVSYHRSVTHVIPLDDWITKLRFALEGRRNPDFVIIGRTDALHAVGGSMEEAARRGRAMAEAGADAVMITNSTERDQRKYFREAVPNVPFLQVAGINDLSAQDYEELGCQIIIYPLTAIFASTAAVLDAYAALKETGQPGLSLSRGKEMWSFIESNLMHLEDYYRVEDLTTEKQ